AGAEFLAMPANARGLRAEKPSIARGEGFAVDQAIDRFGDLLVMVSLGEERVEICIAIRIEEAEPGEVAFGSELLWGRGEQKQSGGLARECFDEAVLFTWLLRV